MTAAIFWRPGDPQTVPDTLFSVFGCRSVLTLEDYTDAGNLQVTLDAYIDEGVVNRGFRPSFSRLRRFRIEEGVFEKVFRLYWTEDLETFRLLIADFFRGSDVIFAASESVDEEVVRTLLNVRDSEHGGLDLSLSAIAYGAKVVKTGVVAFFGMPDWDLTGTVAIIKPEITEQEVSSLIPATGDPLFEDKRKILATSDAWIYIGDFESEVSKYLS